MLTIWSLVWLLAAVLFVAGGALNLLQRSNHQLPLTDGIVWVLKSDGLYAEKIEADSAGGRAGIIKGDKLIGISLDGKQFDQIDSAAYVPMYLEAAGADGNLTYFYQRTAYSFQIIFITPIYRTSVQAHVGRIRLFF